MIRGGIAIGRKAFGKLTSLWAKEGAEELGERLLIQGTKSEITHAGGRVLSREAYEIGVPKGYQGGPGAMWIGERAYMGLRETSIAKLRDVDYVASLSARLSQRAVRQAVLKSSGTEAGFLAESIFRSYSVRLNAALEEANSFYRLFLEQAARRIGPNAGRRVTAWNTFTGRWRFNTKRLDWIISDISSRKNANGLLEAIYGADFTISSGGAARVFSEYRTAFPRTKLIGIDPGNISGF